MSRSTIWKTALCGACGLLLCAWLVQPSQGGGDKDKEAIEETESVQSVKAVNLAYQLIPQARDSEAPEALT